MDSSFSSRNDGRFGTNVENHRGLVVVRIDTVLPELGEPDADIHIERTPGRMTITIRPQESAVT